MNRNTQRRCSRGLSGTRVIENPSVPDAFFRVWDGLKKLPITCSLIYWNPSVRTDIHNLTHSPPVLCPQPKNVLIPGPRHAVGRVDGPVGDLSRPAVLRQSASRKRGEGS